MADSSSAPLLPVKLSTPKRTDPSHGRRRVLTFDDQGCWGHEPHSGGEDEPGETSTRSRWSASITPVSPTTGFHPRSPSASLSFYLLVCCAAAVAGGISFLNDSIISFSGSWRNSFMGAVRNALPEDHGEATLEVVCLLAWIFWEVAFIVCSHCWAARFPMSFGSGVPEIKCEVQKTHLKGYLSEGVLSAKLGGLMLVEASGLQVGKEGPFVHCAAVICRKIADLRTFRRARKVPDFAGQLMVIAVAIGAVSVFAVPVSGVLFAIEITSESMGTIMTYWACLLAAIVGSFVLRVMPFMLPGPVVNLLPPIPLFKIENELWDSCCLVLLSIPLGVLAGLFSGLFVHWQVKLAKWVGRFIYGDAKRSKMKLSTAGYESDGACSLRECLVEEEFRVCQLPAPLPLKSQKQGRPRQQALLICILVAMIDGLVTFVVPLLRGTSQASLLWLLASGSPMDWKTSPLSNCSMPHDAFFDIDITHFSAVLLSFSIAAWKFSISMFAISLPIPCGCIAPFYVIGALLGRFWCHILGPFMAFVGPVQRFSDFALIGAAAFAGGGCRSFGVVAAVAELTNSSRLLLPMAFSSILSIAVANLLSPSAFEAAAAMKRLPVLHQPRSLFDGWRPVLEVVDQDFPVVPRVWDQDRDTVRQWIAETLLKHYPPPTHFPVLLGELSDPKPAPVIGSILRTDLQAMLNQDRFPEKLEWDHIWGASTIPSSTAVVDARLRLECRPSEDLYVTAGGCFLGVVTFTGLLRDQEQEGTGSKHLD